MSSTLLQNEDSLEYYVYNCETMVHIIPTGRTQPQHSQDDRCWCEPTMAEDLREEGGKIVYTHRAVH